MAPFVDGTTVCERFTPHGLVMLRGAVLRRVTADGVTTETVRSADDYVRVLRDTFDLHLAGAVSRRHSVFGCRAGPVRFVTGGNVLR